MITKKYFQRFAAVLFCVIFFISGISASAEELGQGSETGVGKIEGSVKTDVYNVILPTDTKGVFDFILDPQGLINKTGAMAYNGKLFEEDSTVFFKRTDDKSKEYYSKTSDCVTISNKSSIAVEVSLNVSILPSSIEGITVTEDKDFTNDNNASIFLAVTDGKSEVPVGEDGVTIDTTIDSAPAEAYEYIYDKEKKEYIYKLKNELSGIEFPKYSFQLTGAANGKGDWSKLEKIKPEVTVTWKVMPKEG